MKRNVVMSIILTLLVFTGLIFTRQRILGTRSQETTLLFTGDVMLGRTVMTTSLDKGDPAYPFLKVAGVLKSADLTISNLENPIVPNCPRHFSGFKFCADPKMVEGLSFGGIDIVNLSNNHTKNYGMEGLTSTGQILDQNNISYTGVENLVIKEINGVKFGFLGFDKSEQGTPTLTSSESDLVRESDKKADVLVVSMHWGSEYKEKASVGQRMLAKNLVNLGADVVIGHHPHWVEDYENINGVPVYYSLGNFIFDQMWSQKTREGLAVKLIFNGSKLVKEEKLPIYMVKHAQPEWVNK